MRTRFLISLIMLLIIVANTSSQDTQTQFQLITPDNIAELELGYAFPGSCLFGGFSPDGYWFASNNFYAENNIVYDLRTGEQLFTAPYFVEYSPDGQWIALWDDALYSYPELEKYTTFPAKYIRFSPDSEYLFVAEAGVYQLDTMELILPSSGTQAAFSPNSTYISIADDGLYRLNPLEYLMPSPDSPGTNIFSPDENWLFFKDVGLYTLPSLVRQWKHTSTNLYGGFTFSPDSKYIAINDLGVLKVETGELLISTFSLDSEFTSDSRRVVFSDGVYDLATGEKLVSFNITTVGLSPTERFIVSEAGLYETETGAKIDASVNSYGYFFSNDDFFMTGGGIYSTENWEVIANTHGSLPAMNRPSTLISYWFRGQNTGSSCLIYGIKGNEWPYRSGIVSTEVEIDVYSSPIEVTPFNQTSGEIIVYATTADNKWYKILIDDDEMLFGWIRASDIAPVFMPDGIPIENS